MKQNETRENILTLKEKLKQKLIAYVSTKRVRSADGVLRLCGNLAGTMG